MAGELANNESLNLSQVLEGLRQRYAEENIEREFKKIAGDKGSITQAELSQLKTALRVSQKQSGSLAKGQKSGLAEHSVEIPQAVPAEYIGQEGYEQTIVEAIKEQFQEQSSEDKEKAIAFVTERLRTANRQKLTGIAMGITAPLEEAMQPYLATLREYEGQGDEMPLTASLRSMWD